MGYCINPLCTQRHNPDSAENCLACGNPLIINGRIRLLRPLRSLEQNPYTYTDVFEIEDAGTEEHPQSQIRVMKVLRWIDDSKLVELLKRESLILQILDHPGIPKSNREDYFTFRLNDNLLELHCLVMHKFEGENLTQRVQSYGRISQEMAYEWLLQLMEILDLVHRSGFFHRDIKPENIVHQPDGNLALVDFGGARQLSRTYFAKVSTSGGTSTGFGNGYEITAVRTPCYSPLEQIHGQAVPQSDFYALGRTFVYLVTGISLIEIKMDEQTGRLIWRDKALHIDKILADLLDDMMAPFVGQRPQSTQIIIQRLQRLPSQSKLNRVIKSKPFKLTVFVLSIIGLIYASLPLVAKYYLDSGKKAYKENQFDQAENDFQQAVYLNNSLKSTVADYFLNQGKEAYKENRIADAEKDFQRAIKYGHDLTNSVSTFYFEKGLQHQNDPKIARDNYELAIKYNPKDDSAYNNLAVACQQLQDYTCVSNSYEKIFMLKPNKWESHYGLGFFYDGQGKYDLAEKQYKLAIKSSSEAIFAIAALSRLKNKSGDYNTAVTLALQGLSKTENRELQASFYKDLGWARLMQNRLSESKKYLEKAIDLDGQRIDAYCLLSQIQEALGKNDDARISIAACILGKSGLPEVIIWREDLLDRILKK
ncbi:protein kinase [Nostoc sp. KVJ20]|uniref:protein kinase domain-containing protein n=1 Tax=Nostoc sp. KVJ20 TaxID=457944 RepID=UPI00086F319A|nr:4-Cys prefix domain-containing protein [Nostoc sp. KVJ20]ODH02548.1 protein kinase [Nostoc sp. KVJ20]